MRGAQDRSRATREKPEAPLGALGVSIVPGPVLKSSQLGGGSILQVEEVRPLAQSWKVIQSKN